MTGPVDVALLGASLEELEAALLLGYSDGAPYGGGMAPVDFPSTRLRIRVELLLYPALGVWEDVSAYVFYRDKIRITIGRQGTQSSSAPSKCLLTFNNSDLRFSPRNPLGPYYGLLLHNVKMRVSVNPGSGFRVRFTGFISEWPPSWTMGEDRFVSIEANGPKRRLGQNVDPLRSAAVRAHLALDPVAYWSMEDATGATELASEIPGRGPLTYLNQGLSSLAEDGTLGGSGALPKFVNEATSWDDVLLTGNAQGTSDSAWTYTLWLKATMADSPAGRFVRISDWDENPTESDFRWQFGIYHQEPTVKWVVSVDFSAYTFVNSGPDPFDGAWHHVAVAAAQEGPDIRVLFYVDGELLDSSLTTTPDYTLKRVTQINFMDFSTGSIEATSIWMGHQGVFDRVLTAAEIETLYQGGIGWLAEAPTDRFTRLMAEEGIPATVAELMVDSEGMGPQGVDTLDGLVTELEDVNEGTVDDDMDGLLRLTSRTFYLNQASAITLQYSTNQPLQGLQPTSDDFGLSNDYEVERKLGGKYRAQKTTGPLNVNDPADDSQGVFRYKGSRTMSLETLPQAKQHALYRMNKGTVDEDRWPVVPFDLANHPELIPQWLECVVGSRLLIADLPGDVGYGTADQILLGWEETLDQADWQVSAFTQPGSLYQVGILAAGANYTTDTPRLDCRGSTLAASLDSTQSNVDVAITDECVWVHTYGDYPIVIGGEVMMVTAVSAASGSFPSRTQTLTVTRSVNGVVKTHDASRTWEVHVRNPIRMAMGGTT